CIVLMKGMEKFNDDLMEVFKQVRIDVGYVHNFISISSIGYQFAKMYGCFDSCYELSGKPQNFIQRCVCGGRTMTANNKKQYIEGKIQDFDAVSLYPSAMNIMNGVPKGKPKIIPSNATINDLLSYDTFFAEIDITRIKCKSDYEYKFGQVFTKNDNGSKIFNNNPVNSFYIDKVAFQDLKEFYDFDYKLIRGYYFDEGFNNKINSFINKLFNLRLKYKREKNPLQSTIKLLLNSIYGKSILKAIPIETKCVPKNKIYNYIWRNYNFISDITENDNIDNVYVKRIKPIQNHYNLPQFGASVLSWSKHLMNRVISTAEQNGINIFYQDTDSVHVMEDDVERIADIFKHKYGKELVGERMGQFHNDFDSFDGAVGNVYSRKLIALGKKSYLDILVDEKGNEGYHIRLKGIPKQCILNKCKRLNITVEELYEKLYNGEEVTFNLLDGCNCFRKNKSYQQINLPQFNRAVKFI
ncbi:DNA polymerase, partial [uncultured Brachyspira sp.]|uniref:DNA polymerase n=1 Tax=uncultured Brachyspira sp. TaxID=221953 RepID=UPI00262F5F1D